MMSEPDSFPRVSAAISEIIDTGEGLSIIKDELRALVNAVRDIRDRGGSWVDACDRLDDLEWRIMTGDERKARPY